MGKSRRCMRSLHGPEPCGYADLRRGHGPQYGVQNRDAPTAGSIPLLQTNAAAIPYRSTRTTRYVSRRTNTGLFGRSLHSLATAVVVTLYGICTRVVESCSSSPCLELLQSLALIPLQNHIQNDYKDTCITCAVSVVASPPTIWFLSRDLRSKTR